MKRNNPWYGDFPLAVNGLILIPVIRYYEETRDPLAQELITKFSQVAVDLMPDFAKNIGHTHSAFATVSGIFRAGQAFQIEPFVTWAEAVYDEFTQSANVSEFGWCPENTARMRVNKRDLTSETCATVDFLEITLQMAQHRDEKYWDDVERIAMNQLLEGQLLSYDFLRRVPPENLKPLPVDARWITTDHVLERSLGCFGSTSSANSGIRGLAGCCTGSGPRGLYDVWYYASQEKADTVQVNLQFSKRLPSAVVTSYMPGKASLEIKMTTGRRLRVRKPAWAKTEQTRVLIDGSEKKVPLEGAYFNFGYLAEGTKIRVDFPNATVRKTARIGDVEFSTLWRGNAVIDMQPGAEVYPLYQGRNRQDAVMPLPFINPDPVNPL